MSIFSGQFPEAIQKAGLNVGIGLGALGVIGIISLWILNRDRFAGYPQKATIFPGEIESTITDESASSRIVSVRAIRFESNYPNGTIVKGISWRDSFSHLSVLIENESDETIMDLDIYVTPNFPIIHCSAASQFNACRIGPENAAPTMFIEGKDESGENISIPTSSEGVLEIIPTIRLRCERMAMHSTIEVTIATTPPLIDLPENFDAYLDSDRILPTEISISINYNSSTSPVSEKMVLSFS